MSNYYTKAKRPGEDEYKIVGMIDNYFGAHEYGVKFPNGEIYHEDQCIFDKEEDNSSEKPEPQKAIKKLKELKGYLRRESDSLKYDSIVEEIIKIIKNN